MNEKQAESGTAEGREAVYTLANNPEADRRMQQRSAERQAAFFLPHLRTGMRVLDCGCGSGSITIGLAQHVQPGEVVGIDAQESSLGLARKLAAERGCTNVEFRVGDIYHLPYGENSFDAAFSHAVLEHLGDPLAALTEMHRVIRPSGVIGVRAPDFDGFIVAPPGAPPAQFMDLWEQVMAGNGGNLRIGKHLRSLLYKAGCTSVEASASFDTYHRARAAIAVLKEGGLILKSGLIDVEGAARLRAALEEWSESPEAFMANAQCEAVGWKE